MSHENVTTALHSCSPYYQLALDPDIAIRETAHATSPAKQVVGPMFCFNEWPKDIKFDVIGSQSQIADRRS